MLGCMGMLRAEGRSSAADTEPDYDSWLSSYLIKIIDQYCVLKNVYITMLSLKCMYIYISIYMYVCIYIYTYFIFK